jgi:DNA-binding CsgD family transcriptional regulator/PAS domain-containing protein
MDRAMVAAIEPPDELLNLIYDAAAEEELWTQALIDIADLTGSLGGFMYGVENKARMVTFMFNGRMSEESHRVYRERHMVNPWAAYMNSSPVGRLVQSDDIVSLPALQRTAFFDEVLRPQEMAHNAMVPLAAKRDFQVGFNMCRSARQGPFEADELLFISRLFPHLRRSLLLGFRLDGYKALQQAQFSVLDRLAVGVILLDRATKVIFANSAARAMTAGDGPLRLRNSVVTAASPASGQRLGGLIDAALRGAPLGVMSVPHPDDGRLLTVLASSIRSRDIDRFGGLGMRDAAAMVFIFDPARPLDIPAEWIMDAYRLTLAEARVALSVSSGASVAETAHRLNISPNTVKTHLRRVFVKTGASRQADLARIIASIGVLGRDPSRPA